jgi:hypothetical protein
MKFTDFLDPILLVPSILILLLAGPGFMYATKLRRISDGKLLSRWASDNAVQIVKAQRRNFFIGPLTWRYSKGIGFRISVFTEKGERRNGWLAFVYDPVTGNPLGRTDVVWD